MRLTRVHSRLRLLACVWCLGCWTASVEASWEAYQRAGEAAYERGDYATAEEMFLAAVREAKHLGLQDPRLDISLNKLALLRVVREQPGKAEVKAPRAPPSRGRTPGSQLSQREHRRQPARTARQRGQSKPAKQTVRSARLVEGRKSLQEPLLHQERQRARPRVGRPRAQPTSRIAAPRSPGKRHESIRRHVTRQKQPFPRLQVAPQSPAQQQRAAQPVRAGQRRKALQAPQR